MMDDRIKNPYRVTVEDVVIKKFGGAEPMSIFPQFVEFVLYQSIFSPILKAQLVVYDAINLLNNYPLMGEETVEVYLVQEGARYSTEAMKVKLTFIIAGINNVEFGNTGRDQTYFIDLHSAEAFENAKRRVSKAYRTSEVEKTINDVVNNYLRSTKPIRYISHADSSVGDRVVVVPNLNPLSAITWLCKLLSPMEFTTYHNFIFYETVHETASRFNFKPLQQATWRDSVDEIAAKRGSENHPYFFITNYAMLLASPETLEGMKKEGFTEERMILNVKINKRYSVLEKIIGGYFDNEFVEIDLDQKDYKIVNNTVKDPWKSIYGIYLQSNTYIDNVIATTTEPETSPNVKYAFFNFAYPEKQDIMFKHRWGKYQISKQALAQIDLSIDIHTNLQVVPGDLIYLNIPEMHGYEESRDDRYLTGWFMITENKMIIRSTGETTMLLRVNKDSYQLPISDKSSYELEKK